MIARIDKGPLVEGLSKTAPIGERRSPMPILSHVLMDALESKLILTVTDLEVGIRLIYDCEIEEPGKVAAPARKMFEIARELPQGQVKIESNYQNRMTITSGESVFHLSGMDAADYPVVSIFEEVPTVPIQAEKLAYMLQKTVFASSNDESRLNLNGVLFEPMEDKTRLVATDGHRLAMTAEDMSLAISSNILVPKKSLIELERVLEGMTGDVQLGFDQKNLVIRTDRATVTMRLIDGEFPDYRKVIPEGDAKVIKANRQELLQSVRRVGVLTTDRNKGIHVQVSSGALELKTLQDLGTGRDVLQVEYDGESFGLLVNVVYLMEALNVVDTNSVYLEYFKTGSPLIIRPDQDKHYFNLVMPMSTK